MLQSCLLNETCLGRWSESRVIMMIKRINYDETDGGVILIVGDLGDLI